MAEKIFCEKCRFVRSYLKDRYVVGHVCMHDVCFKDTSISPRSKRYRDCGDDTMNLRNDCQYFKKKLNLFEYIGEALWGEKK